jgi:glycosyltransferase involved in cell wall biosynthesis
MKRVGVCGNFGANKDIGNGQIVKTKVLTEELKKHFGNDQVIIVDTFNWKKNPFKLFLKCLILVILCQNVVILPAQNGIKVFIPLFSILCKIFKRKLHYSVIGGWLPEFLLDNQMVLRNIKSIKAVYVETHSMKKALEKLGIKNVVHMPNFKNINLVPENFNTNIIKPYNLCTFSRVKKEKGIIDAINAVKEINERIGKRIFHLDIYGPIDPEFKEEFYNSISKNEIHVHYKGEVNSNQSTEVLKNYFALIFPTYYEGEGFPGTIIDAFSSGLPVIATDWRYNSELVSHGKTGFLYKLDKKNKSIGLKEVLVSIYEKPQLISSMKNSCLQEVKKYDPSIVMLEMIRKMEE